MKEICFHFDIIGKQICIPIYHAPLKFRRDPEPDPRKVDPVPEPWRVLDKKELLEINPHLKSFIKNGLLDEKTILDVNRLGLISSLADQLNPALRERFQAVVQESVAVLNKQDAFVVNIG